MPYKDKKTRNAAWHRNGKCAKQVQINRNKKLRLAGRPRPNNCEVCGDSGEICWDHCHSTMTFRGWICKPCNSTLGFARDNPEKLRKLAMYIEQFNSAQMRPIGSV